MLGDRRDRLERATALRGRARPCSRRPPPLGDDHELPARGQPGPDELLPAPVCPRPGPPGRRRSTHGRQRADRAVRHPDAIGDGPGRHPVGRQPAEGRRRARVQLRPEDARARPADARPRRRQHRVHPQPGHRDARRGRGDPARLRGARRGPRAVRSDRRDVSRRAGGDAPGARTRTRRRSVCSWRPAAASAQAGEVRHHDRADDRPAQPVRRRGRLGQVIAVAAVPVASSSWPSSSRAFIILASSLVTDRVDRLRRCRSARMAPCSRARSASETAILEHHPPGDPARPRRTRRRDRLQGRLVQHRRPGPVPPGGDGRRGGRRPALATGAGAHRDHRRAPGRAGGRRRLGLDPGRPQGLSGAHEVVTTIMLNSIAAASSGSSSSGRSWRRGSRSAGPAISAIACCRSSSATTSTSASCWRSRPCRSSGGSCIGRTLGFEIRTVGANPSAARYAGMRPTVPDHAHDDPVGPPVRVSPDRSRSSASATS